MEIPVSAKVRFADGCRGAATHIVIDLQGQRATHLVVKSKGSSQGECLVPIALIAQASPNMIRLRCSRGDVGRMMPFTKIEWTPNASGSYVPRLEQCLRHVSVTRPNSLPVKGKLLPVSHVALGQNTPVETTNGHVGYVENLLIYPQDGRIIRLAIRTGRLWNKNVMLVPFWRIARIGLGLTNIETPSPVPAYL